MKNQQKISQTYLSNLPLWRSPLNKTFLNLNEMQILIRTSFFPSTREQNGTILISPKGIMHVDFHLTKRLFFRYLIVNLKFTQPFKSFLSFSHISTYLSLTSPLKCIDLNPLKNNFNPLQTINCTILIKYLLLISSTLKTSHLLLE